MNLITLDLTKPETSALHHPDDRCQTTLHRQEGKVRLAVHTESITF